MSQHDKDVVFFVTWVLNKAAQSWGKAPAEVYRLLQGVGIVDGYLIAHYDVVHSMGERAILNDLETVMANRGLAL